MKLGSLIDRCINWGNSLPATPWQMAALFSATVILRNLMEAVSIGIIFPAPAFFLHFPVAYVYPLLTLVFFMRIFSRYDTAKLLKIMVFAWTLTLLPPLIDSFIGSTSAIGYFPLARSNAGWFLLNFFNPSVALTGTTTGIRIEAAIGCILAGIFTWAVAPNRKLIRGVLNTVVFAPVFLTFFTWPYLIAILFQPFFPGDGLTHSLLQWHAATEAPVTGASHYIIYIIDMIPVSLLALWYVKELSPDNWRTFREKVSSVIPLVLSALLGLIAAALIVPAAGLTFADAVTIAGAFLATLWLIAGSSWKGNFRGVSFIIALTIAWASGWITLVLGFLAITMTSLPGGDRLRYPLFGTALFLTAISPVGFSLASAQAIILLVALLGSILLSSWRKAFTAVFFIPLIILILAPLKSEDGAFVRELARRTDTFNRSSRVGLGMESASVLAAAGGPWLTLAETTHMNGMNARSRYICETAIARGHSSPELLKVYMNLAFARGDTAAFNNAFASFIDIAEPEEINEAMAMRLTTLALSGDTTALNSIHARAGINPFILRSMATGYMVTGDTLRSLQYSLAFLDSPDSQAEDWAAAISLAAAAGNTDWDSLYNAAQEKLGYCLPVMLARLRAPMIAAQTPDREDLLTRCLLINPAGSQTLETAAMWYTASERYPEALIYASRALAGNRNPSPAAFSLVINAAVASGNLEEAEAALSYALTMYPTNIHFLGVLRGVLQARNPHVPVEPFTDSPLEEALSDSIAEIICGLDF